MLCPLPTNPPHEHELLTSKKSVPYIRCPEYGTHLYFRSDLAKGWLDEHLENGGIRENPIDSGRANPSEDEGIETPRRTFPCPECDTPVPEDAPRCPGCDEEIRWESGPARSEKKLDVIERAIAEERERLIARGIDPDTGESMR